MRQRGWHFVFLERNSFPSRRNFHNSLKFRGCGSNCCAAFPMKPVVERQHSLVSSVAVGDSDTAAVPATVFRHCTLNAFIFHQSDVALHEFAEVTRCHRKRVLISPTHTCTYMYKPSTINTVQQYSSVQYALQFSKFQQQISVLSSCQSSTVKLVPPDVILELKCTRMISNGAFLVGPSCISSSSSQVYFRQHGP